MLNVHGSTEALQQVEAECLAKFRSKAAALRAATPGLSRPIAFAKAVEALPKTAGRYNSARMFLTARGVAGLPLEV